MCFWIDMCRALLFAESAQLTLPCFTRSAIYMECRSAREMHNNLLVGLPAFIFDNNRALTYL
jgi:hypothetical protein